MSLPDINIEKSYSGIVVGVDEAGRGPCAGPVVAAAVILDHACLPSGINDSKQLTQDKREALFEQITATAQHGVGICSVAEIDKLNILHASMLAMRRAVDALGVVPHIVLVDGNRLPRWNYPARAIIAGDALCLCIAAASIIAKVTRDRMMVKLAERYPGYGWEHNAGYNTRVHQDGMGKLGITPEHRRSFAPVRKALEAQAERQQALAL